MPIDFDLKNSKIWRSIEWLLFARRENLFAESKILKWLSFLNYEKISMAFFGLSVVFFWYETFFNYIALGFVNDYKMSAIFLVLSLIFCNKKRLFSTRPIEYLIIFILILMISGLFAAIIGLESEMLISGILLFCQFALAFFVTSAYKNKTAFLNTIFLISLPMLLVGIYQFFCGGSTSSLWVSSSENLITTRVFGFFGSPNILGSVAMVLAVASSALSAERHKWYYLIYTVLAVFVMFVTFSRSAWLGFALGLVIVLFIKNWRFISMALIAPLMMIIPSIRQRIMTVFSAQYVNDSALDGRVWAINDGLEVFKTSPLTGTGPGTYGGQTAIYYNSPVYLRGIQNGYVALPYTDNQWLQIMIQGGLVAIVCVGSFFTSLIANNLRQYKKNKSWLALGIIAASVAIIINGFMANVWEFGAVAIISGGYLGLGNIYE